jgi:glutathione S-transferase
MIADRGERGRQTLKVCALATGLADKAVSLIYERVLHQTTSDQWIARCRTQISDVLTALEVDRTRRSDRFWFGDVIGHADVAVTCALRFTLEAHPGLFDAQRWPTLAAHATACEALKPFQDVVQPFLPPS